MDTYIIAYDIRNPKRLQKVFKTMKDFGEHRQYSIFECRLSEVSLLKLKNKLENIIDKQDDQVLIIRLCESCLNNIEVIGIPRLVSPDGYMIV